MKTPQYNLLTTGKTVSSMLETLTAPSAPPALLAARTALDNLLDEINGLADEQAKPIPPRTRERNEQFAAAADAAYVLSRLAFGHAFRNGLTALAGQVDFAATELSHGRFSRRIQRMRQIASAVKEHAAELVEVGVTAEMLADAEAKIALADSVSTAPRSNIIIRRTATANLERAFTELEHMLRYSLDPLMDALRSSDPDTYARYVAARHVIDLPGQPAEEPAPEAGSATTTVVPTPLAAQPLAA